MNPLRWLRNQMMPERKARLDATQRMDASYSRFMIEVGALEHICRDLRHDGITLDPFVADDPQKRIKHDHH